MCSFSVAAATTRSLRVVHYKHTAKIAAHARVVRLHTQKLLKLQREIKREAAVIVGADYKECHNVGYDEYGSMASQRAIDDGAVSMPIFLGETTKFSRGIAEGSRKPGHILRTFLSYKRYYEHS
jgi:hypothetical protein